MSMGNSWRSILLSIGLTATCFVGQAQAWLPQGWTWQSWPYAYDHSDGTWHWFNATDEQWVYGFAPASGWSLLSGSGLGTGWSYVAWPYAYDWEGNAWYYINEADSQWSVDLNSGHWSLFGKPTSASILQNGSFSSSASWTAEVFSGAPGSVSISNGVLTMAHSTNSDWCSVGQDLAGSLVSGRNYLLSLRYRTTTLNGFWISWANSTIGVNNDGHPGPIVLADVACDKSGEWRTITVPVTYSDLMAGTAWHYLAIVVDYNMIGSVEIDEVALVPVASSSIVQNGSFGSVASWTAEVFSGAPGSVSISNGVLTMAHNTNSDWCSIGQDLAGSLVSGRNYLLSLRYRTTTLNGFWISWANSTIGVNNDGHPGPIVLADVACDKSGEWRTITVPVTYSDLMAGTAWHYLAIVVDYNMIGSVEVDEVALVPVP